MISPKDYRRGSLPGRCRHKWRFISWIGMPFEEGNRELRDGVELCKKCGGARLIVCEGVQLVYLRSYAISLEEALLGRKAPALDESELVMN